MRRKDVSIASLFDAESTIAAANNAGAEIMLRSDDIYPERLAQTARPPLLLYYKGDASRLDDRLVGIVGARNASLAARRFAEEIAADLSTAGIGIVSGLARGIDAVAHRGSMQGLPIGVVAGGIDVVYPPEHAALQTGIAKKGIFLAESQIGAKPTERHFPRRNRIVAGLGMAVTAIEAAECSGSLITTRFAMEETGK
jgi:DNA processing protein